MVRWQFGWLLKTLNSYFRVMVRFGQGDYGSDSAGSGKK